MQETERGEQLSPEVELVRDAYIALNRNDIDGFLKIFAPDVLRVEFEGSPMEGTFRGIEAVTEHVKQGRSTWAEGGCDPERFVVSGNKVVVTCHVLVRLNDQPDWLEGRTGDVFTFRDGKITEFRTFGDESDALKFAGLTSSQNRER